MSYYTNFPTLLGNKSLTSVFAGLSTAPAIIYDMTQLVPNTTNLAGAVNGSGNVTGINSVAPAALSAGKNMSASTAPALTDGGVVFSSAVDDKLSQASITTDFDFTYVSATSVKWTMFLVAKVTDDNALTWFFGNNGAFANNGGCCIGYDTVSSQTFLVSFIFNSVDSGGRNVCVGGAPVLIFGSYAIYALRVDSSLVGNARIKGWRGVTSAAGSVDAGTRAPMTTPNGTKFEFGDGSTFGGTDATTEIKLFALVPAAESDAAIESVCAKLSAYTGVPL
jgi:hypothetical protein